MARLEVLLLSDVFNLDHVIRANLLAKVTEPQHIALLHAFVVGPVFKSQRQDAEVHQVLLVDAREFFRNDYSQPEESRGEYGMFPARSLAVIAGSHDDMTSFVPNLHGAARVSLVYGPECKLDDFRNVTAKRQQARTRGQNLVGRDVIAYFEQDGKLHRFGERFQLGQRSDVGTFFESYLPGLVRRWRGYEHPGIEDRLAGLGHLWIRHAQIAWVGDHAFASGCGRGFRANQTDFVLARAGAAGKVARHGAQTDLSRGRRLPHPDATIAARLMNARAGPDQSAEVPVAHQVFEDLS